LFALGSERYTPYLKERKPQEILTIANHILGKNQLSLAKYLFIAAKEDAPELDIHDLEAFLQHVLERIDLSRDINFYTKTTIDTLDYSGSDLNAGSKVVFAVAGDKKRTLCSELPANFSLPKGFEKYKLVMPGVLAVQAPAYTEATQTAKQVEVVNAHLKTQDLSNLPLMVLCNDADFTAQSVANFVWVTFTRSNPSHDIHGVNTYYENKHWCCGGPLIIDARIKSHHAPVLEKKLEVEKAIERFGKPGASLHGIL
jgi:4-hydroxy-3-polyprenylbenzoate decarboxylase